MALKLLDKFEGPSSSSSNSRPAASLLEPLQAPERFGSLSTPLGPPTDLYEVGLFLHHALSGQPAFDARLPMDQLLDQQLRLPPAPLSAAIPRPLRSMVKRLLEPDPLLRYASYLGLRHDLDRLAAGDREFCIGQRDVRRNLALPDFAGAPGQVELMLQPLLRGGLLNLVGPSGSGKSRLLEELGELARSDGLLVFSLRGEPLGGSLEGCLGPLLTDCDAFPSSASAARQVRDFLRELASMTDSPLSEERGLTESLLEAKLEALFKTLPSNGESTVVVLVDDAQWISVTLLRALSHACQEGGLAVVAAGREISLGLPDLTLDVLAVEPLRELLQSMAGPLPHRILAQLITFSGGSPFMAVEGLRGWWESGFLRAAPGGGWLDVPAGETLQASFRAGALLAQRLDGLGQEGEKVLGCAALLGRSVQLEATAHLCQLPLLIVKVILRHAVEQRFLWRAAGGELVFCHDRLREELEARIPSQQRAELHRAAALWLAGNACDDLYRLAYHYHQAGDHAEAKEPALAMARTSRRAGDLALAERCYRMAVLAPEDRAVQREMAEVLVSRGTDFAEAESLLRECLENCESPMEGAQTEAAMANLQYRQDQPGLALEHLKRAIQQLGEPWPERAGLELKVLGQLMIHLWRHAFPGVLGSKPVTDQARFELNIELYKRAAEASFEMSNVPLVFWAHFHMLNDTERYAPTPQLGNLYSYHLALLAGELGYSARLRRWRPGLRALDKHGSPHQRGKAGVWMAMRNFLLGRLDRAERTARRALLELAQAGDEWEAQMMKGLLSNVYFAMGRLPEALELARQAYFGAVRWNNSLAAARALLAWAQASEGAVPRELLEDQMKANGNSAYRVFELYQAEAASLAGTGDYLGAVAALQIALEKGKPLKSFRAIALPWKATWLRLAHDQALAGQRPELLRLARRAAREAADLCHATSPSRAHALRELALMAARRGNTAVARAALGESLDVARKLGQSRERALSLEARGALGEVLGWSGAAEDLMEARRFLAPVQAPDPPALKVRFATLLETARILLENPSREGALTRAAEALRFMLRAERGWVLVGPPARAQTLDGHPPFSRQDYELCLQNGQPLRVAEPEQDETLARHGVRSALYVPLGPETAIFLTHSRVRDLFAPEDLALCQFLAQLTWAALESRRILTELRDSEVRFRTLFENAGVGLQIISLQGKLLAENACLRELLALGGGDDPLAQVEGEERARERSLLDQVLTGERESYSLFLRHRRHNGSSAWTQVTSTMVYTSTGEPARVVRAISDVSTRHLEKVIDFGEQQHQLLALDLHDVLAQRLVMAKQKTYLGSPETALGAVRDELETAVAEVRKLHRDLASPQSARRSYRKALRDLLVNHQTQEAIELDWRLSRAPGVRWPRGMHGLFAYRIVQEALSNVLHHAQARRVKVRLLVESGRLRGEVSDDGVGLSAPCSQRSHLGLAGIRLRCELLGGRCQIRAMPDGGTRLRFFLPTEEPS